ncbi:MAG: cytochrome c biogenesis protein CcdA [Propionibacteriaceae bacterium]|nr:cytochrome c biogenesis protein CcdA [Propionibacteriaceae bacterium]
MVDPSLTVASILVVFGAGLLAFASPCFLPVVPVFVGYLAGKPNVDHMVDPLGSSTCHEIHPPGSSKLDWSGAAQALVFIVAFSAVFISLWGLVGLIGWVVGGFRTWLRIVGGIVLVIIGLHASGLISISVLDRILQPRYSPDRTEAPNLRRSLLLGLAFGAGWTPCIGPILGGVLGLATTSDSLVQGIILMVVFSLGLGLPFVLVCAGATWILSKFKWFTAHRKGVNLVIGIFLIIVGFLMIADLFSRLAALFSI